MRRAWQRSVARVVVACLAFAIVFATASRADAFHAGSVFGKPAGAGGGGGVFYTGVPSERGWDCNACHRDAPKGIRVRLDADDPSLFVLRRYTPGHVYAITATMIGERLGHDAAQANFNSLAVATVDAKSEASGTIDAPADDFVTIGAATITAAGQRPGETAWTFKWTAPNAGAGSVSFHVAAVDGNGAGQVGGGTLTDPWGDDVFVGKLTIDEGATTARRSDESDHEHLGGRNDVGVRPGSDEGRSVSAGNLYGTWSDRDGDISRCGRWSAWSRRRLSGGMDVHGVGRKRAREIHALVHRLGEVRDEREQTERRSGGAARSRHGLLQVQRRADLRSRLRDARLPRHRDDARFQGLRARAAAA